MNILKKTTLFRKPPPVLLPHQISRKHLYILPTSQGCLFLAVLTGMLLGSVNYNNNLGFLLTFLLGSMTFVSMLHTHRNLLGTEIHSVRAVPVFAGEKAVFRISVRGGNVGSMAVRFSLPGGEEVCEDIPQEKVSLIEVSVPTEKRGLLKPGMVTVSTRYPLGLFRTWTNLDLQLECPVYPAPLHSSLSLSGGNSREQQDAGESAGRGADDFEGLRTYQPGDPMQHISWKAYSKGQGLMSKTFVGQAGALVFLDWAAVKGKNTEHKLSRLCGMVLAADRLGLTYGLKLPATAIDPGKGEGHKHNCLRELALFGISRQ
ncbi:MAG: DUF58 domain-containing protein [Desulfobacterales bacterium]